MAKPHVPRSATAYLNGVLTLAPGKRYKIHDEEDDDDNEPKANWKPSNMGEHCAASIDEPIDMLEDKVDDVAAEAVMLQSLAFMPLLISMPSILFSC